MAGIIAATTGAGVARADSWAPRGQSPDSTATEHGSTGLGRDVDGLPGADEPIPVGRVVYDSKRGKNFELYVMNADGSDITQLTNDDRYDSWWPRLSPDRRTIVFVRTPRGVHDLDYTATSIWAVAADGGEPMLVRAAGADDWAFLGHPEWSPDGEQLVVFGGAFTRPQIYLLDTSGSVVRQVTDRPGTNIDPSFTPDGTAIVFVGCPKATCKPKNYEIYRVSVTGGTPQRLTRDRIQDHDPVVAPDGSALAWLSRFRDAQGNAWDIRVATPSGADPRRLVGDNGITSRPEWSRSSQFIYAHRLAPDRAGFDLYRFAADGSTELRLTSNGNNEYPGT